MTFAPTRTLREGVLIGALASALAVALTVRLARPRNVITQVVALPAAEAAAELSLEGVSLPDRVATAAPEPRADATLQREGRTAFAGGYLALTHDFSSADGVYDVVFHFHGNTELVEQSLGYAHINAVFVPLNLGTGSGAYEDRFASPDALPEMLSRVQTAMERRGLAHARLGRVALIAWSAGYGAVMRVLEHEALAERVDAVILLDALHIGRVPRSRAPERARIAPYERFGRWAIEGRKLFTITHSEISPGTYVGARETTDVLLERLGVLRVADGVEAPFPAIPAMDGVLTKARRVPLPPMTLADRGKLTVRGYGGEGPDHHMLHLAQMATIALPDLAAWWSRPRDASP